MGWVLIIIVTANLLINFAYIVGKAMFMNCRRLKIKYLIWRRARLRRSVEKKHEEWLMKQALTAKPMSPRSVQLWHRFNKELGNDYDASKLDLSDELSFNSNADLMVVGKKARPEDELILNPLNKRRAKVGVEMTQNNQRSRNAVALEQTGELAPDQDLVLSKRKGDNLGDLILNRSPRQSKRLEPTMRETTEYVISPLMQQRMDDFYNKDASLAQTILGGEAAPADNLKRMNSHATNTFS